MLYTIYTETIKLKEVLYTIYIEPLSERWEDLRN